ncbi:MAG: ARMT1-like domain-containing protein [Desulfobacterales bacterium]
MRTYFDCYPCFIDQALRAGRMATDDEQKIKHLLDEVGMMLKDIRLESTPPETARLIYQKVKKITGKSDPYRKIKKENTDKALTLYPSLKRMIEASDDRLVAAIRLAIAGNIMDFGANKDFDIEAEINEVFQRNFAIFNCDEFRDYLAKSKAVLFIADNAGECVFDRLLIEEMKKPVTYVVRGAPVVNDAIYEDAVEAGVDKVALIMSSGTDAPGTILATCSREFRRIYDRSSFIISKGQGNYEALCGEKRPIFFFLKAKCGVIAKDVGVNQGDIVLKAINS